LQFHWAAVPMESLTHKYWATWAIQWLCMMALWFAFVSKVELAEGLIGVFATAAAATGDLVIRRQGFAKFRPEARWFLAFWREPWWVLNGTVVIFWALVRRAIVGKQPDSTFRSLDFDAGRAGGQACARRALALILTTLPPNSVVIGIDEDKNSMLVHQLQQSGEPEVMKELK